MGTAGFEPATVRLEGECSIQLSYIPKIDTRFDQKDSVHQKNIDARKKDCLFLVSDGTIIPLYIVFVGNS